MKRSNQSFNCYQRKGYKIEHFRQRTTCGHEHTFIVHDQGSDRIPPLSKIILRHIPTDSGNGKKLSVVKCESQVRDIHHIQYTIRTQYV